MNQLVLVDVSAAHPSLYPEQPGPDPARGTCSSQSCRRPPAPKASLPSPVLEHFQFVNLATEMSTLSKSLLGNAPVLQFLADFELPPSHSEEEEAKLWCRLVGSWGPAPHRRDTVDHQGTDHQAVPTPGSASGCSCVCLSSPSPARGSPGRRPKGRTFPSPPHPHGAAQTPGSEESLPPCRGLHPACQHRSARGRCHSPSHPAPSSFPGPAPTRRSRSATDMSLEPEQILPLCHGSVMGLGNLTTNTAQVMEVGNPLRCVLFSVPFSLEMGRKPVRSPAGGASHGCASGCFRRWGSAAKPTFTLQ